MTTTVAVVVPCRNEATSIRELLDAVISQTRPPDDLVIVDDGSTDRTVGVIEDWRRAHPLAPVRVIASSARGAGAAMNTGIAACATGVIVRLDGHSVPAPDYIERSLDALSRPGVGIAGGVWVVEPGAPTRVARAIGGVVSHPLGSGGAAYRHGSTEDAPGAERVETVPFGTFRRDLWRQLGGFDETLAANQDFDFNYRARRAGLKVVLDRRIRSIYRARPTLATLARQYHRYGFWKVQMLRKDPRALHWRQIPPALALPWVLTTGVFACVSPSPVTFVAAAAYPAVVVAGAAHIALRAKEVGLWPAASAALVAVHLAWSAGFWRALLGVSAPHSAGR